MRRGENYKEKIGIDQKLEGKQQVLYILWMALEIINILLEALSVTPKAEGARTLMQHKPFYLNLREHPS